MPVTEVFKSKYTPCPNVVSFKFLKSILNNFVFVPSAAITYKKLSKLFTPNIFTPANSHLAHAVCTFSPLSKKYLYTNIVSALVGATAVPEVYGAVCESAVSEVNTTNVSSVVLLTI